MLGFKQVELQDQEVITKYFHQGQYMNSECTFTNLYIWRDCYQVEWAIVDGYLIVKPTVDGESWILPPFGEKDAETFRGAIQKVKAHFDEVGLAFSIRAITEEFKAYMETAYPGWFAFESERDIYDYIYSGEDLRELKGRKFSKKRNHLNNFYKNYPEYQYLPLTQEWIPQVRVCLEEWCKQKECDKGEDDSINCERKAVNQALDQFGTLDYNGGMILIEGKVEAFTLGEAINDETVVVHVEKARGDIQGLYPAINKEYQAHTWPDKKFINREEDLGDEGLRKAKESYYPVELLAKYKGVIQGD